MLKKLLDFIFWHFESTLGRGSSSYKGYYKIKLFESKWLKRDIYLIWYPVRSSSRDHVDPSPITGLGHYRTNVVLIPAKRGGKFVICGKTRYGRIHRFRADKMKHRITEVKEGTRYVLSFGRLK